MLPAVFLVALAGPAADEPKLPGPKVEFPKVEGFTLTKPRTFPDARLGYSVAYNAPGVALTAYVYDKGLADIPAGAKSEAVRKEARQAADDIQTALKRGLYTAAKEVGKEEVVQLGKGKDAPEAVRRRFEIERPGEAKTQSDIYLTGYKAHFVKLRVTYDPSVEGAEKQVAALLVAVGGAIK